MRFGKFLPAVGLLLACFVLSGADAPLPARLKPLPVKAFYETFEEVPVRKDTGALFAPGVYLGTAGTEAHYNSLTLGWGASGVLWGKPVAIVYIRENRFSFRYFEENPVFVLSWYGPKERPALFKIFGGTSGRDTDKEKLSGFTPVATPEGAVTYLQAEKVVICRKVLRTPVPEAAVPGPLRARLASDGFIHIQYTGEVLSVWRRKAGK